MLAYPTVPGEVGHHKAFGHSTNNVRKIEHGAHVAKTEHRTLSRAGFFW